MYSKALLVLALSLLVAQCAAGPVGFILTYGACQTACNAAYVTCCTAAGTTAGHFIKASPTCDKYLVRGINKFRTTNQASGRFKRNGDKRD
ncbi:unnamed protein product [Acanthoscelides obtectus]|uniref:Uncharacterized protein n=1 Tax=Acanthoscelides obtectus TaxID=200917 RepID=A0A9P0JXT6_ACAOB|nr:unnamed protein product [Acanthoscelides obtectus]CAK1632046.1 hypothetical protein AOBTE_LOCUS7325 [Acanthoscelides obtectus]